MGSDVTVKFLQDHQPWTVLYANCCKTKTDMCRHAVLHAAKTVGKLSGVFEERDHTGVMTDKMEATLADMAADLMTAALRLANLCEFDLALEVVRRSEEKNGVKYPPY